MRRARENSGDSHGNCGHEMLLTGVRDDDNPRSSDSHFGSRAEMIRERARERWEKSQKESELPFRTPCLRDLAGVGRDNSPGDPPGRRPPMTYGCDGNCGFLGDFDEVAQHELTCDKLKRLTTAAPNRETIQKAITPAPAHGANETLQASSVSTLQRRALAHVFQTPVSKPGNTTPSKIYTPYATTPQGRGYTIALDVASMSKDSAQTGADLVEIHVPVPVSPRAVMEEEFRLLEQGIDTLPKSPRPAAAPLCPRITLHSPPPSLPFISWPAANGASPSFDPGITTAFEAFADDDDDTENVNSAEIISPIGSPGMTKAAWQERGWRVSTLPDDCTDRVDSALRAKPAARGGGVIISSNPIEISSEISSPVVTPMGGKLHAGRNTQT